MMTTQRTAAEPDVLQENSEQTFDRLVDEGEQRLGRSWLGLAATGFLGGLTTFSTFSAEVDLKVQVGKLGTSTKSFVRRWLSRSSLPVVTLATSMGPLKGMVTRGRVSKPSSLFSIAVPSQIELLDWSQVGMGRLTRRPWRA